MSKHRSTHQSRYAPLDWWFIFRVGGAIGMSIDLAIMLLLPYAVWYGIIPTPLYVIK